MKLILATKNKHKVEEFCRILSPLGWQVIPQDEVCPPDLEIEETGSTFAENAFLKAMGIYRATGLPTVADDSGLCVDALGGAPGVYSARYAGEGHNSDDNNKKLLREMEHVPDEKRTARFVCAICAVFGEGDILRCEGARWRPSPAACTDKTASAMTRFLWWGSAALQSWTEPKRTPSATGDGRWRRCMRK